MTNRISENARNELSFEQFLYSLCPKKKAILRINEKYKNKNTLSVILMKRITEGMLQ